MIGKGLASRGYEVTVAGSCVEAERALAARPHAAVLDYQLPDGDALALLDRLRTVDPELPAVILTAHGSIELAVEAMQRGAQHFLAKPADMDTLVACLERCLESGRGHRRQRAYDAKRERHKPDPFRGTSKAIRGLERQARQVAAAGRPVLLAGETGSGKGLLAHWLHDHSPRAEEPFVDLNCAGLQPELLASELFGHNQGAFTGASNVKPGLLEVADRGTLFLDEIGDMDLAIQARFLKVLEEQTFRRVGGLRERRVDVRLIAATHRDLGQLMRGRRFRSDLYYRINTLRLEIPPLRRRWEDVASLAEHFLAELGRAVGRPGLELSCGALEALVRHRWPGNVRELRNVLERAVLMGGGDVVLERDDLRFDACPDDDPASATLGYSLEEIEKWHVDRVIERADSVTAAARQLGISRTTLYKKIRQHDLTLPSR